MLAQHKRVSFFAHFDHVWRAEGDAQGNTVLVRTADGWFWLIPVSATRTSVGVVLPASEVRRSGLRPEALLEQAIERAPEMARRMQSAVRATEVQGTSDFSYRTGDMTGPGFITAGDAYSFLDPIFSTGVWLAMRGGAGAAETVAKCLRRPARTDRYLRRSDDSFNTSTTRALPMSFSVRSMPSDFAARWAPMFRAHCRSDSGRACDSRSS
jgi:flavin-dependent dehydrogenase